MNNQQEFNPILNHDKNKSTIKTKKVKISGNNSFSKFGSIDKESSKEPIKKTNRKMTSQRVCSDTVEKVKLLSFFLPNEEKQGNISFDQILNKLIDYHVDNILTDRQKDMFRQMCENNNLD